MSTLNDFIGSVAAEGLMGSSKFEVEIGMPNVIKANNFYVGDLRKILLYCDSITLPGMNISTTQARTFGEIREMPYERLFDNVTMNFYVDNGMHTKLFFDTWINSIQNPFTRKFNYYKGPTGYTTDISLKVFDINSQQRYQVDLYECYPKSIGAITMDYSAKEVMKLQVSMNYKYWLSHTTDPKNEVDVNEKQLENATIPNDYFTDFPNYQGSVNSFENARANLYQTEPSNVTTGLGSIFT
jgi:hypothetical protein